MVIRSCLITGGTGFLGRSLARELARRGCAVTVLDTRPATFDDPTIRVVTADVCDLESVEAALAGVDTVFHTAAVVALATVFDERLRRHVTDINVGGTETVIAACRRRGVKRLVYTSTCQVAFTGEPFDLVTEEAPYARHQPDLYGRTKQAAERAVLAANGQDGLLTAAIRPSGIYGPGEEHHLPRMIRQCARHLFCALLGDGEALSEWSYIDNLVHGHILAAEALVPGGAAPGQAYFINDGEFIDSTEMFRPIVTALGYRWPSVRIPAWVARAVASVFEHVHRLGGPAPLLTRVEVQKMTVRYPCSIGKARRDLGYEPVVPFAEAVNRCIPYCRQLRDAHRPARRRRSPDLGHDRGQLLGIAGHEVSEDRLDLTEEIGIRRQG